MAAIGTGNFHALKDFLDFSGSGGMAQMNAVAGFPGTKNSFQGFISGLGRGCRGNQVNPDAAAEERRGHLAGDHAFVLFRFLAGVGGRGAGTAGEADFAMGALAVKTLGEFELLASFAGEREGTQRLGGRKIRSSIELGGSVTEQPALDRDGLAQRGGPGQARRHQRRLLRARHLELDVRER